MTAAAVTDGAALTAHIVRPARYCSAARLSTERVTIAELATVLLLVALDNICFRCFKQFSCVGARTQEKDSGLNDKVFFFCYLRYRKYISCRNVLALTNLVINYRAGTDC